MIFDKILVDYIALIMVIADKYYIVTIHATFFLEKLPTCKRLVAQTKSINNLEQSRPNS